MEYENNPHIIKILDIFEKQKDSGTIDFAIYNYTRIDTIKVNDAIFERYKYENTNIWFIYFKLNTILIDENIGKFLWNELKTKYSNLFLENNLNHIMKVFQ